MKLRGAVLGVGVLAVLGASAWGVAREDRGSGRFVQPQRRDLRIEVAVEGELVAASTQRLGPPSITGMWNFKISYLAPEGSEAKAGDRLIGFDPSELQQKRLQKIAERDSAAKELEKKRLDLDKERRAKTLQRAEAEARLRKAELQLATPMDIEASAVIKQTRIDRDLAHLELAAVDASLEYLRRRAEADLDTLRRRRDQAGKRVEQLETQISALDVLAPQDGTVIYVADQGEEKRKVGDTVWVMQKVVELPNLDSLGGDGWVAEADAGRVAVGQPVTLRFDAFPDTLVRGSIRTVARTVQSKPASTNEKIVRLKIALDQLDPRRMRPGMRFRGSIEVTRAEHALVVPLEAVFYGPGGPEVRLRGGAALHPSFGAADKVGVVVLAGLEDDVWLERRGPSKGAPSKGAPTKGAPP